jgi:excisionase family DNA binding protein
MPPFVDVKTIANKLRLSTATIYEWAEEGYIPHTRVGRLLRFDEEEILKWLKKRAHPGRTTRRIETERTGWQNALYPIVTLNGSLKTRIEAVAIDAWKAAQAKGGRDGQ